MIRAFSLTAIVCLTMALFWHSRLGVARPGAQNPEGPAPVERDCRTDRSCAEALEPSPPPASRKVEAAVADRAASVREEFHKLTQEAWHAIPLKRALQSRTDGDLHYASPELVAAVERVGLVDEALEVEPSLALQGLKFFKDCAVNDEFPTSVRALCYHRWRARLPKEKAVALTDGEVPDEVRALSEQLDQQD